uniref:DUF2634 domain-containing protein n=1 Tax=Siphoviridae sp. ctdd214 TaxID=2825581 RepID=A0A8S5V5V4_9CAUD|nr:MAG TPA: Protein of unknown function (DUF2634) [Siphoviridae sp. ctdd214]
MSLPIIVLDDDIDFDNIELEEEEEQQAEAGYTYKLSTDRIQNNIEDLESVKQAVKKILMTPQFEYEIYSFDYGIDLESLIGREPEEITVLLKRMVREALTYDDRVTSVDNFEIRFSEDECLCEFTVSTVYGEYKEELEVSI